MVQLTGVGTIVFNRPEDKDEGMYQCFAENEYGTSLSIVYNLREAKLKVGLDSTCSSRLRTRARVGVFVCVCACACSRLCVCSVFIELRRCLRACVCVCVGGMVVMEWTDGCRCIVCV